MSTAVYNRPLSFPFFTGTPSNVEVPDLYPVGLDGHPYLLDDRSDQHRHVSIPFLRDQFLRTEEVGENALNPDAAWRRSQSSWHKGAGQVHLDHADSDRNRFRTSKGIDVWERWQVSLLPDVTRKWSTTKTNVAAVAVGDYLYVADGNELLHSKDLAGFTVTGINAGEAAQQVRSIATDGFNVWAALGSNGVHTTTRGAVTSTHFSDLQATLVGYVKGRLMAAKDNAIYNITAAGVAPVALFTHPNPDFRWAGFTEGDQGIYCAGWSGDKSAIYRVSILEDGTGLGPAIAAGHLPDGERVLGVGSYLGFVLLGTTKGVRLTQPAASGDLQVGSAVPAGPVRCFEGQDRFVWFGWDNYDPAGTGLGRLDLTVLNDDAPAYASDLIAPAQGAVTAVVTHAGRRVFTVAGSGVWQQSDALVPAGTLDSGLLTFDVPDDKVALTVDVRHSMPLPGSHELLLAANDGPFLSLGVHPAAGEGPFSARQTRGEQFELRHVLRRSATATKTGPVIRRHTLMAIPAPVSGATLDVPLLLAEWEELPNGAKRGRDVCAEREFLTGLRQTQKVFTFQEGCFTFSVRMADYQWVPSHVTRNRRGWNGTFVARLVTLDTP
jgi:hypothetical protein